MEFIGYIPEDHAVLNSLRQGRSLMSFASTSNAGQDMIRLARRVLRLWDQPIPNSADSYSNILSASTRKAHHNDFVFNG